MTRDEAITEIEALESKLIECMEKYTDLEFKLIYADKFEKIKSYCEEQKDTWEAQESGCYKVYEKILKELNNELQNQ